MYLYMYLKGMYSHTHVHAPTRLHTHTHSRERSYICRLTPQMPAASTSGQAEARSLKLTPDLHVGWQGPTYLSHCLLPPRVLIGRKLEQS